jgi:hypothetical protein
MILLNFEVFAAPFIQLWRPCFLLLLAAAAPREPARDLMPTTSGTAATLSVCTSSKCRLVTALLVHSPPNAPNDRLRRIIRTD